MIENRKAKHDYIIESTLVAGISLAGWEVKSINLGSCDLAGSHVDILPDGKIVLLNAHIVKPSNASLYEIYDERRARNLLIKKRERDKLSEYLNVPGRTIVVLKIFRNERGWYKALLGQAKGKRKYDKRETEKEREAERELRKH